MIIKKLNGMFHKHGRWLFGVITVVIIISFVGFLAPGQFGFEGLGGPGDTKVGTAFGKKVTYNDLQKQARFITLFQYMLYGRSSNIQPEQLFTSFCVMEYVRSRGITVSDAEVVKYMQDFPAFMTNGKFDLAKYRNLSAMLNDQGFSNGDIADAVRMVVAQEKLRADFENSVIVTPDEVEQFYRAINGSFDVIVKQFPVADYRKAVVPNANKVQEFFKANQGAYTIPGKASGLIAKFPYANYAAKAAQECTDAEVNKYFTEHRQDFAENGKVPEFKTISAKVRAAAINARAMELAKAAAYDYADTVYNMLTETAADKRESELRKLAAQLKITLTESGMLEAGASVMGAQLNQAYGSSNPLTEIISDEKTASVGVALNGVAARPAKMNEVSKQLQNDYITDEAMKLARKAAAEFRASVAKAGSVNAARALFDSVKAGKNTAFKFSSKQNPPAGMEMLAYSVYGSKTGDSAEVPGMDEVNVILVVKRYPADMKDFESSRPQYEMMCRARKVQAALAGVEELISTQCRMDSMADQQ